MATKEELSKIIKDWVSIDNEIKILQKEIKDRRNNKKILTNSLIEIMKTNEIDCFDINNGKIMYSKNNVKKPITKKHLLNCLSNYFDDVSGINSDNVVQFILDNREIVIKDNIRLKNK
jgi:DNA-binding protein Fis